MVQDACRCQALLFQGGQSSPCPGCLANRGAKERLRLRRHLLALASAPDDRQGPAATTSSSCYDQLPAQLHSGVRGSEWSPQITVWGESSLSLQTVIWFHISFFLVIVPSFLCENRVCPAQTNIGLLALPLDKVYFLFIFSSLPFFLSFLQLSLPLSPSPFFVVL